MTNLNQQERLNNFKAYKEALKVFPHREVDPEGKRDHTCLTCRHFTDVCDGTTCKSYYLNTGIVFEEVKMTVAVKGIGIIAWFNGWW